MSTIAQSNWWPSLFKIRCCLPVSAYWHVVLQSSICGQVFHSRQLVKPPRLSEYLTFIHIWFLLFTILSMCTMFIF